MLYRAVYRTAIVCTLYVTLLTCRRTQLQLA
jgi:hypothetical protein